MLKKDVFFILLVVLAPLAGAYCAYKIGYMDGYYEIENQLKECASEVSLGCPRLIHYATMLEDENARLNKRPRKCP